MRNVGYYYCYTAGHGKHWDLVKGHTDLFMDWELDALPVPPLPGKRMWVDLGLYGSEQQTDEWIRRSIEALRSKWGKIIAFELGDEFKGSPQELNALAARVRSIVAKAGLPQIPLGATFTYEAIMRGSAWRAKLDWRGIEAYIEWLPGETPLKARLRARKRLISQIARIELQAGKIGIVAQGYDLTGAWKNPETLVAIQEPAWDIAAGLGDRLSHLGIFNFSKKGTGGTKQYPTLKAEHKRLQAAYR